MEEAEDVVRALVEVHDELLEQVGVDGLMLGAVLVDGVPCVDED